MPTMSTLDINWEMNQTNVERAFSRREVLDNNLSPFSAIYAPSSDFDGGKNLKHVEITPSMVTWLQGEMQIGETEGGATVVLPNANTQQVVFSKDGVISRNYTVNQNGLIALNGDPSVKVSVGGCGAAQVDINNGGNFNIGSATTAGEVTLKVNSTVKITSGGNLNLTDNSQLIIKSGGKLIIEAGANINLLGLASKITIKGGGELVINGTNGTNPNFNFSGNGYFNLEAGNILTLNNDWILRGSGKTTRLINISHQAKMAINGGRRLTIQDALIRKEANISNQDVMRFNNGHRRAARCNALQCVQNQTVGYLKRS